MSHTNFVWTYFGERDKEWVGIPMGILSFVRFKLVRMDPQSEEFEISSNIRGLRKTTCIGLIPTKEKAQELFNNHVKGLIKIS